AWYFVIDDIFVMFRAAVIALLNSSANLCTVDVEGRGSGIGIAIPVYTSIAEVGMPCRIDGHQSPRYWWANYILLTCRLFFWDKDVFNLSTFGTYLFSEEEEEIHIILSVYENIDFRQAYIFLLWDPILRDR
ncbi:hypothetical protein ACJX0J_029278, partial [Zea mays]